MKNKYNAFTLIELSIVLVISSMLLMLSFGGGQYFLEQNHIRATRIKLETIQNALDAYLIQNRKLPCPASLSSLNGEELSSCVSSSDGVFVNSGVARGWVPYKELNLTPDIAYDSWGSKITYSVSVYATGNFMKMEDNFNGIIIYDNTTLNLITEKAVYSINSHGKNKLGAYNSAGHPISTAGISISENVNVPSSSNLSNEFVYFSNYNNADDIGRYKTRMQMIISGNIENISCHISGPIIDNLLDDASITDISESNFTLPPDNFLKYGESLISEDNNYKIKCFKYGRLGVSFNE